MWIGINLSFKYIVSFVNKFLRDYLVRIYESIESKPIEMAVQTAAEADAAQANINKKLAANDLAANRLGLSGSNGSLSSTGGSS